MRVVLLNSLRVALGPCPKWMDCLSSRPCDLGWRPPNDQLPSESCLPGATVLLDRRGEYGDPPRWDTAAKRKGVWAFPELLELLELQIQYRSFQSLVMKSFKGRRNQKLSTVYRRLGKGRPKIQLDLVWKPPVRCQGTLVIIRTFAVQPNYRRETGAVGVADRRVLY